MLRVRQPKQLSLTGSLDVDPYDFKNPGLQALSLTETCWLFRTSKQIVRF